MLNTPLEVYRARIKSGELNKDPGQAHAALHLDHLFTQICDLPPRKTSLLSKIIPFRKKNPQLKGMYMYGGVGRGKSMIMDLFYECLPAEMSKRRVHFHQFMIETHNYIHERRTADSMDGGVDGVLPLLAARISEKSHILCFDEFHVTDIADAMILGRLFTALFDLGVIIVATSNWPPERLYEDGLQRERFVPFITLLQQKMDVVHLDSGIDYRTQKLPEAQRYFTPLNSSVEAKMDALFASVIGNKRPQHEEITVKGRKIVVRAAVAGAARFTFAQLCEQPHGAEDYIAIAKRYDTVLIEGVPKMGYDRRNEAKRFMTLIDALYEARTRVIFSADARPDALYQGHDHAFEFDRTISRLNEMQSKDYLQS